MNLLDLPPELIAKIFTYLEDENVFAARLSSRTLEKASFDYFGRRFFRKKGFMITTFSLMVLGKIADHQHLRKFVQHLWFNPDCFTFLVPCCRPNGEPVPGYDNADLGVRTERIIAWKECVTDHRRLLKNGNRLPALLESHLTNAFRRLPNLTTIGMRRSESHSPYGWSLLQKVHDQDPRELGPIPDHRIAGLSDTSLLFMAMISAVAKSNIRLRRLYTDAVELDNISPQDLTPSTVEVACSSILYLELNMIRGDLTTGGVSHRALRESSKHLFGENLVRLLESTPKLKEIGLQILPNRQESHPPIPAEQPQTSYAYLAFDRLANEVTLPHLTRIKLEKLITTSQTLQHFLNPCSPILTSLKLRDISLLSSPSSDVRPWRSIFNFLLHQCPQLDYILFYHLMHDAGGVSFVEAEPEPRSGDTEEYVVGQAVFEKYSHITLEVCGKEAVRAKLDEVMERHWYHKPLFSYAMDEDLWHTDTSDEEW